MAKVKLALKNLTVLQIVALIRQIIAAMTMNLHFPTPKPTLVELGNAADLLETTYNETQAARLVAQQKTELLTNFTNSASALLTQLAAYVENAAGGDATIIQSGGMSVRADVTPVGDLPVPTDLSATVGDHEGEIDLDWDSVRGATGYVVQKSADPITATSWQQVGIPTKSKMTVTGLTSGAKYWFRVAANGAAGQGGWSQPATKIAP